MSHLLWKLYHEGDVDKFRQILGNGHFNTQHTSKSYGGGLGNTNSVGNIVGSPSGFATSPRMPTKNRKVSGQGHLNGMKGSSVVRSEVNSRDHAGLTILHRAVSSTSENAIGFAMALLDHPAIDLYVQDTENGWTALHRALYFGHITLARAIMERDQELSNQVGSVGQRPVGSVIKVKDHEGNSPFDVYNATIARRSIQSTSSYDDDDSESGSVDESEMAQSILDSNSSAPMIGGDEIFAWGSNRNHGLGFKEGDDRQHPEKIALKRPDHLLFRFYREYLETLSEEDELQSIKRDIVPKLVSDLPALVTNKPIVIQDVVVSKLHSAILTTDPESNLYICGYGKGGRLGTGDENTRFSYVPIEEGALAGKKVITVALGQNHTLAVASDGSILSWGTNTYGQLGYSLPRPALQDEEPVCLSPRQIFGPLKKEFIIGVAASVQHSVAHTSTSLYTWGKNKGQLGLMDSDSRSLDIQSTPRKVAASLFKAPIAQVSAINAATIVLLANHTVCVFTNYGYNIVKFPLHENFTNYHLKSNALTTRYDSASNHISSITAGGDTIGAISSRGDLFTVMVRNISSSSATSTTNPAKIKESLSQPERIWSLRKGNWDGVKSVGITENGSVIVCTQAGAVWHRITRAKNKDDFTGGKSFNRKDFKFQRIAGLTKVAAVRSTIFGVYTAIRKDCDVTKTQITVDDQNLWQDVAPLLAIRDLEASPPPDEEENKEPRFWTPSIPAGFFTTLKRAVLTSPDLEADVRLCLQGQKLSNAYNIEIGTTTSDVLIPIHSCILARSVVLRSALDKFRATGSANSPEIMITEVDPESQSLFGRGAKKTRVILQGLDFIAIVNLIIYLYTDTVIDVWHFTRHCPRMAFRYRQVRVELMKTANHLKLRKLEAAVRLMVEPERQMNLDLQLAIQDSAFFSDADTIIELDGAERAVHSALMCQRCPFFEGLFNGRAGGQWLAGRRSEETEAVRIDLKHIQPDAFEYILRYVYGDVGTELFDDAVCADIDEFSDLVMDVMAAANELMLDRLSQICQQVIGRFGKSSRFVLDIQR